MPTTNSPDRSRQMVWTLLAIVGAVLAVVGWYRWATP
jgi:hypothetical protein